MRERTTINLDVVNSDHFLSLPHETQALYFQLVLRANDDGIVNNPKAIVRIINSTDDGINLLFNKGFIENCLDGTYYIAHWNRHTDKEDL
jgi:hypothetical protein